MNLSPNISLIKTLTCSSTTALVISNWVLFLRPDDLKKASVKNLINFLQFVLLRSKSAFFFGSGSSSMASSFFFFLIGLELAQTFYNLLLDGGSRGLSSSGETVLGGLLIY